MRHSRRSTLLAACVALAAACGAGPGPPAAAPTFSPSDPLRFRTSLEVTLATATAGAAIHYTTDGSPPTPKSPEFQAPFTITDTTTVRAITTAPGMTVSPETELTYRLRPVDLVVDDGTYEVSVIEYSMEGGMVGCLNRFTPDPDDYPFRLAAVSILSLDATPAPLRLVVFSDGNGIPDDGATLEATLDVTAQPSAGWSTYPLDPPLVLRGPGDVLIGRFGSGSIRYTLDTTAFAGRSYGVGWWDAANAAGLDLSTADFVQLQHPFPGQANAGNALIRGSN